MPADPISYWLDPISQEIMRAHVGDGVCQIDVGIRLGLSQPTICYAVERATSLVRRAESWPYATPNQVLRQVTAGVDTAKLHRQVAAYAATYVALPNFTLSARVLKLGGKDSGARGQKIIRDALMALDVELRRLGSDKLNDAQKHYVAVRQEATRSTLVSSRTSRAIPAGIMREPVRSMIFGEYKMAKKNPDPVLPPSPSLPDDLRRWAESMAASCDTTPEVIITAAVQAQAEHAGKIGRGAYAHHVKRMMRIRGVRL
jgi:hypothetical protein